MRIQSPPYPRILPPMYGALATLQFGDQAEGPTKPSLEQYAKSTDALDVLKRVAMIKDGTTGEHIVRMAQIAGTIASHIGLPPDEVELIIAAAPLHDIGKIAVPDAILQKPGKLTPDELVVMRSHCHTGHEILRGFSDPALSAGADIALNHHEKWDGSGYPNGKQGAEISLFARIVAVADVLDALVSSRPYKAAWSMDDAIQHIEDGAGAHFDPEIATCVRCCRKPIEVISRSFNAHKC